VVLQIINKRYDLTEYFHTIWGEFQFAIRSLYHITTDREWLAMENIKAVNEPFKIDLPYNHHGT
jgi:hypothetical protein